MPNYEEPDKVVVNFEKVTILIGPNGAGKSSVLRAMDWFFNGDKSVSLTADDIFSGAEVPRIVVRVDFVGLSESDRHVLGDKYAPAGVDEFSVWRIWEDGKDKITGKALAFVPFENVRSQQGAGPKKTAYEQVIADNSDLAFPKWTSLNAVKLRGRCWCQHGGAGQ